MAFLTTSQAVFTGPVAIVLRWAPQQPTKIELFINGVSVGPMDRHAIAQALGDPDISGWLGVDEDDDDEDQCEGHESTAGAHMGETVYCDGSCT